MERTEEMKKLLGIIGAVLVIGSIGACDTEAISLGQAVKQCLIGLPLCAIGVM